MRKISTGQDSTVGVWLELTETFFGETSKATEFLKEILANSPNGESEEIIADEGQLLQLLASIHLDDNAELTNAIKDNVGEIIPTAN